VPPGAVHDHAERRQRPDHRLKLDRTVLFRPGVRGDDPRHLVQEGSVGLSQPHLNVIERPAARLAADDPIPVGVDNPVLAVNMASGVRHRDLRRAPCRRARRRRRASWA
jgi:hypothetical protein